MDGVYVAYFQVGDAGLTVLGGAELFVSGVFGDGIVDIAGEAGSGRIVTALRPPTSGACSSKVSAPSTADAGSGFVGT